MKVACIQMEVLPCSKQENLEKALSMAREARNKGAEIIVLPEVFSTGFCYDDFDRASESFPYPTLRELARFSETYGCVLLGSIIEKKYSECETAEKSNTELKDMPAAYYNLGFCLESGTLVGTYRKTHPFKAENCYFSKGNSLEPIALKKRNLKIGFEICYELRFPEVSRKLALADSDLLVTIAAFPKPRDAHWRHLSIARSIENQLPHIACNRTGRGDSQDISYFGGSMVIDAWGEVKADAGEKECVIVYELEMAQKTEVRKKIPALEDRRPELY